MKWKEVAIKQFYNELQLSKNTKVLDIFLNKSTQVHLAIFVEPYLSLIFQEVKTIESRFSMKRIAPFHKVNKGDIVLIKKSAGPVQGYFTVADALYYELSDIKTTEEIEYRYGSSICTDAQEDFWEVRKTAKYASLIIIDEVFKTNHFQVQKKDRTGWVILEKESNLFDQNIYEKTITFDYI